jgi:hypothetical protein
MRTSSWIPVGRSSSPGPVHDTSQVVVDFLALSALCVRKLKPQINKES